MSEADAWLLNPGPGLQAAVGALELVHLLPDTPTLFEVPHCPPHCHRVLVWQEEILPLVDLATRLMGRPPADTPGLIAVVAYQEQPNAEPNHGALALDTPPTRIRVNDAHACALPEGQDHWRPLAIACFDHAGSVPVPVLDLQRLFSSP